jgi:hypothetical protein
MDLIDVISVRTLPDYKLLLEFETGEKKIFDFSSKLEYPIFKKLKNKTLFDKAHVMYGTVVWDENTDIAPERLYSDSIPVLQAAIRDF